MLFIWIFISKLIVLEKGGMQVAVFKQISVIQFVKSLKAAKWETVKNQHSAAQHASHLPEYNLRKWKRKDEFAKSNIKNITKKKEKKSRSSSEEAATKAAHVVDLHKVLEMYLNATAAGRRCGIKHDIKNRD